MAYVRNHGNQLAIVHGMRDPVTRKVHQKILFKICSKSEARAAIGEGDAGGVHLEPLLESRYRQISFDWERIRKGIEERIDDLPDSYPYRQAEMLENFRADLCAFTRQLAHADPQSMYSAAELLQEHRAHLEYLRDLLNFRLAACDQTENEWNGDNVFFWRIRTQPDDVPPEVIERMSDHYLDGDLDRVEALARLFIDCFEAYADGHNYLGRVALDRGHYDEAIEHFERAIEKGRKLFPKRLAKKHFGVDLDTRPYMRGLGNLVRALHLAGRYAEALEVCERLKSECGEDLAAASHRADIFLADERWEEARDAANEVVAYSPDHAYTAAFASQMLGEDESAIAWFLHGLIVSPRAGQILLGQWTDEPRGFEEVQDHNRGVDLCKRLRAHLDRISDADLEIFRRMLRTPTVQALIEERRQVDFRSPRRKELTSLSFAFRVATELAAELL